MKIKDALIKSTSISASRTRIAFVMIPSLKSAENTACCGIGVVKRPSGGIEERAGGVIPHYVGPATLLRHSLPAHPSLPLIFADLIRASLRNRGPGCSVGAARRTGFPEKLSEAEGIEAGAEGYEFVRGRGSCRTASCAYPMRTLCVPHAHSCEAGSPAGAASG